MRKLIFYKLWKLYTSEHKHFISVDSKTYFRWRWLIILAMTFNKDYIQCEIFKKRYKHLRNIVIVGLKWNGKNVRRRTNGFAKDFIRKKKNVKCLYCGVRLTDENVTADHIVPVSKGGNNTKVNLIVCCESCNSERGDQDFGDYLKIKNKFFKNIKYPFI